MNAIIEKQNIDIDTISEATATSKAYLKSIEKALQP
ncbi:MAG: FMN-binding protein [Erysipelothrix sp.]|nr:FMN-binding protein [Erysipelothrix sp.]